jgi:hypothetical protein
MGRRRHRRRTGQGKQRLNGIRVWAGIQPPVPMVRIKKSMLDDEGRSDAARPVTRVSLLSPYDGSRTFQASFIGLPNLNMRVLSSCSKSPSIPPTLEAVVPDPIALAVRKSCRPRSFRRQGSSLPPSSPNRGFGSLQCLLTSPCRSANDLFARVGTGRRKPFRIRIRP